MEESERRLVYYSTRLYYQLRVGRLSASPLEVPGLVGLERWAVIGWRNQATANVKCSSRPNNPECHFAYFQVILSSHLPLQPRCWPQSFNTCVIIAVILRTTKHLASFCLPPTPHQASRETTRPWAGTPLSKVIRLRPPLSPTYPHTPIHICSNNNLSTHTVITSESPHSLSHRHYLY